MTHWNRLVRESYQSHRLERGDLRFVLLDLLEERPGYGYEQIRALEEQFHGFYTPSPGTIYPTLQWLEDIGYVTAAEQEGRKMYTITDEGRRFLAEHRPKVEEVWERMRSWWSPDDRKEHLRELLGLIHELRAMARGLRHEALRASPDKLRRAQQVAMRAAQEIEDIFREPDAGPADPRQNRP